MKILSRVLMHNAQANSHNRKKIEAEPGHLYPLDPIEHPDALPASDFENVNAKTGSTEPYQTNTGKPLEQR